MKLEKTSEYKFLITSASISFKASNQLPKQYMTTNKAT